jgi:DNA phosphorothioation-associated putative methyltransferase
MRERAIAAAPGIFYVFKDASAREAYSISRFTRSYREAPVNRTTLIYEQNKPEFQALSEFIGKHGRTPEPHELEAADILHTKLGSLRRAFRVLQRFESVEKWANTRERRTQDTLVYLALTELQI